MNPDKLPQPQVLTAFANAVIPLGADIVQRKEICQMAIIAEAVIKETLPMASRIGNEYDEPNNIARFYIAHYGRQETTYTALGFMCFVIDELQNSKHYDPMDDTCINLLNGLRSVMPITQGA